MERDSAIMASSFDAMEGASSPSLSSASSGCQSGWTLYLEHSNGARCDPAAQQSQRWVVLRAERAGEEEDSMASDASSGPRPRDVGTSPRISHTHATDGGRR